MMTLAAFPEYKHVEVDLSPSATIKKVALGLMRLSVTSVDHTVSERLAGKSFLFC